MMHPPQSTVPPFRQPQQPSILLPPSSQAVNPNTVGAGGSTSGAAPPFNVNDSYTSAMVYEVSAQIYEETLNDVILGIAMSVHAINKTRAFTSRNGLDGETDIFGTNIKRMSDPSITCDVCQRPVGTGKFAGHLEKCLGKGRKAARRKPNSNNETTNFTNNNNGNNITATNNTMNNHHTYPVVNNSTANNISNNHVMMNNNVHGSAQHYAANSHSDAHMVSGSSGAVGNMSYPAYKPPVNHNVPSWEEELMNDDEPHAPMNAAHYYSHGAHQQHNAHHNAAHPPPPLPPPGSSIHSPYVQPSPLTPQPLERNLGHRAFAGNVAPPYSVPQSPLPPASPVHNVHHSGEWNNRQSNPPINAINYNAQTQQSQRRSGDGGPNDMQR